MLGMAAATIVASIAAMKIVASAAAKTHDFLSLTDPACDSPFESTEATFG